MRSLALVTLFALCASSMAYTYTSVRRLRRSDNSTITLSNSTAEVQAKLQHSMGTLANAINREDLPTAAEAGKEIARTLSVAEEKGLVHPKNVTEAHVVAGQLEQAASTANKKQATDAAKVIIYRTTPIVNALSNATNATDAKPTDRQALDDETEALVNQLQNTMEAMIQSLENDNLYLAAKQADHAAKSANKLSSVTNDRADSDAAVKLTTLAEEMQKASDESDTVKAKEIGAEMSKVSSGIAPEKLKSSPKTKRGAAGYTEGVMPTNPVSGPVTLKKLPPSLLANTENVAPVQPQSGSAPEMLAPTQNPMPKTKRGAAGYTEGVSETAQLEGSVSQKTLPASLLANAEDVAPVHSQIGSSPEVIGSQVNRADSAPAPHADTVGAQLLANLTEASAATKSAVITSRMDDALNSTHELKKVAAKAAATDTISREDAEKIHKAAVNVEKAVTSGDHQAAADHAKNIQDRVEEIISAKQPEVAENLHRIDDLKDKPVLEATPSEKKIMREAISEMIDADPLIPDHKKEEATEFTYKMMTEGFEQAGTTHGQLVASVEAEAAKLPKVNATGLEDRNWYGHRHHHHHYGYYPYGYGYYPGYYSGFGYRHCNYYYPYGYCQRLLYGDFAHYGRFHHFFRRPYHHYHHHGHRFREDN